MARDAGARKVIVASCAPPIRFVSLAGDFLGPFRRLTRIPPRNSSDTQTCTALTCPPLTNSSRPGAMRLKWPRSSGQSEFDLEI
jgi:hypothetical protein